MVVKKLSRKAAFGINRLFLRLMSAFWAKKGHFKPLQPIWSKNVFSTLKLHIKRRILDSQKEDRIERRKRSRRRKTWHFCTMLALMA
jgi:hypothetical protein